MDLLSLLLIANSPKEFQESNFFLEKKLGSLDLMTESSKWQGINGTKQKGFCTILPLAHSVVASGYLRKAKCHLPLRNLSPPCSSWILLWLSAAKSHCLRHPLPLQAGSFPSHSSLTSRKTIRLLLLRGLQHEFKQMRQLWSHLASPLVSLNLNSPFQTHRRKPRGCREGLGEEACLKPSH